MNQKERDAQRALGNMEEFIVTVMVPIKVNVRMTELVEAVSKEDAIEKAKMIRDIIPNHKLLRDALSKAANGFDSKTEFDTLKECEYTAEGIMMKNAIGQSTNGCEGSI